MSYILLFGMPGGSELIFIILLIIMLFGSKKIPELARGLGKGMREIKNATGDIQREIREGAKDVSDLKDNVDVKKQVKDMIHEDKEAKKSNPEEKETSTESQTVHRRGPYSTEQPENSTE